MKFSGEYRVNANDMDVNSIVSASGVLRFMQDAAYSQMEEDGMSYGTLVEEYGVAFILSKIRMSLYAPLYSHDRILGESWACPSRGATFLRCHRILRGSRVVSLHLHFQHEAPLGETIRVYHGELDGVHYLRTTREDGGTNVEAEIRLEEME